MPNATPEIHGRVEAVLTATDPDSIVSTPQKKISVILGHGIKGDRHAGPRLADVRERALVGFGLPKGIEIANHRQISIVSAEDLTDIGAAMGLPSPVPRGCLGENLIVSGIPALTTLPSGTLLFFRKDPSALRTAVIAVWGENVPCTGPGEAIQRLYPGIPGLAALFPKAAAGRRGLVGSVYCSGHVHQDDEIVARLPARHARDP